MKTTYSCEHCDFTTTNLEEMIAHEKTHTEREKLVNEINAKIEAFNNNHPNDKLVLYRCSVKSGSKEKENRPKTNNKEYFVFNNPIGEEMLNKFNELIDRLDNDWR